MSASAERSLVESFEAHRSALTGLAYRMLGSRAEAEDVVQDAYLRWHTVDPATIEQPRRYLGTVVTRLCLDRMKSAKARHEIYVGQWLPEPVVDEVFDPDTADDLAHDLSVALMLVLERLSPLERAAFLLHDVFGLDFAGVAAALGRGETACRQLAARARGHIEAGRPRFPASKEEGHRLAAAFREAAELGDAQALARLLAEDAVLYTDGGGKRAAAFNPIHGADKICGSSPAFRARTSLCKRCRCVPRPSMGWQASSCAKRTGRSARWPSSVAPDASLRSMSCATPRSCATSDFETPPARLIV